MGNLGARQHFWFTARRAARQNHQQHRAGIPAAAATIHISEPPNPAEALLLSPSPPPETPGRPKTPTDQKPPPTKNPRHPRTRKSSAPPPATPGPAPASTTGIGSPFGTSPPCTGRQRPACKVPIMTAAHSGTPAAVFVCQHPHSTANLRQNQYPHPEMRKILLAVLPDSCARAGTAHPAGRAQQPLRRRNAARQHGGAAGPHLRKQAPSAVEAAASLCACRRRGAGGLIRAAGGSPGTRTRNLRIKSPMLCQIELATQSKCTPSGRLSGNGLRRAGPGAGALRGRRRGRGRPRPGG